MADEALSPESVAMASAWRRQVARLDMVRHAEADAMKTLPQGPFGSPENDRREAAIDVYADMLAREGEALISLPAPDIAGVIQKLEVLSSLGLDVTPNVLEACLDDLKRLKG